MALESQQRIVVNHAVAVVDDADHPLAADFCLHANRLRARVQRIFEQFFDYRGRSFDNFARGDFICDSFRQYANSTHYAPEVVCWASNLCISSKSFRIFSICALSRSKVEYTEFATTKRNIKTVARAVSTHSGPRSYLSLQSPASLSCSCPATDETDECSSCESMKKTTS